MSTEVVASWLRVRQKNASVGRFLGEGARPSLDEFQKPRGNALLAGRKSAQPLHHRIFWREETSSASLWEGTKQAIEGALVAKGCKKGQRTRDVDGEGIPHQTSCPSPTGDVIQRTTRRLSPAVTIREVSKASDLQRLSRLLNDGRVNTSSLEAFAVALRDANPAVVEMWLHNGKQLKGEHFLKTFRSWCEPVGHASGTDSEKGCTRSPPWILPLHLSSHAGSPEIVSVLLRFISDSYSCKDRKAMVNARDMHGRTALHLASWSPRLQCPGKRSDIVR
ncbi:unnamed protein product, partial [Hapterophycus canaliculatus]